MGQFHGPMAPTTPIWHGWTPHCNNTLLAGEQLGEVFSGAVDGVGRPEQGCVPLLVAQCRPCRLGGRGGGDGEFQVVNAVDRCLTHGSPGGRVEYGPRFACGRCNRGEEVSVRFHENSTSSW